MTPFRIPERMKMVIGYWIEQATLDRVSPTIYIAGDMGEVPLWSPQNPLAF